MSEVITGTLRRIRRRKRHHNWTVDFGWLLAEQAGTRVRVYEPDEVYVSGDKLNTNGQPSIWNVPAKPFAGVPNGARVRFTANVRHYDNGNGHSLGGACTRVKGVDEIKDDQ